MIKKIHSPVPGNFFILLLTAGQYYNDSHEVNSSQFYIGDINA